MLSNKLTFSLVLVLMFAFVAVPVFAQTVKVGDQTADPQVPAAGAWIVIQAGGTPTHGITGLTFNTATLGTDTDLADLLNNGGSIELSIAVGDTTADPAATADTNSVLDTTTAADLLKLRHMVVISEIMWGYDRPGANNARVTTGQWIEIYNHGGLKTADDLRIHFSTTKQAREPGTKVSIDLDGAGGDPAVDRVILDQVSTVDRFGTSWEQPGSSGDTDGIAAEGVDPTPLVSMFRKINLDAGKYKVSDRTEADDSKTKALDGLGDGTVSGSWAASSGRNANLSGARMGSPGGIHVSAGGTATTFAKTPASLAGTGVIINEVRNDTSEANLDWVEFFNNTDPSAADSLPTNIENWTLSIVTVTMKDDGTIDKYNDDNLFSLPKYKFQPGDYLVVYNRDPGETILAGGVDLDAVIGGEQVNKGSTHMYVVRDGLDLPSDMKFTLILRNGNDKKGTHEKIVDFAGNGFYARNEANKFNTDFWPLIAWPKPAAEGIGDNSFTGAGAYGRVTDLNDMGVYWPKSRENDRFHGDDWADFGFVGAGYDRDVDPNSAPGTPGYPNVAVNFVADDRDNEAMKTAYAFNGAITISEVMYDARHPRDLVQWIELYNSSSDTIINLDGWRMEIRNIADGKVESYVDTGFDFDAHTKILPNQTLLLVSRTGPSSVPRTRVYDLNQRHRKDLGLQRRDKVLLSSEGFYLELRAKIKEGGDDKKMMTVDTAGNLMVDGATRTKQWDLPPVDGEGSRASIVRQYDAGAAADGSMEDSWKVSDFAGLAYYGHRDDTGTPGYRRGGPLPVSLSSFRPVRNQTTGHVEIRWITESELNNAGFNILRAEGKDGEFEVINLQGIIAGHGTTSEKHVYTFTDKTAKPNVVYYYQIEDVSLNGNRTTLATTHMRGNVSAAGKVTTTWGDLKLQK